MPNISTTFECDECGSTLEATVTYDRYGENVEFSIIPCGKCLEEAREEGREEVRDELE